MPWRKLSYRILICNISWRNGETVTCKLRMSAPLHYVGRKQTPTLVKRWWRPVTLDLRQASAPDGMRFDQEKNIAGAIT
jgi:hypothetical protein